MASDPKVATLYNPEAPLSLMVPCPECWGPMRCVGRGVVLGRVRGTSLGWECDECRVAVDLHVFSGEVPDAD